MKIVKQASTTFCSQKEIIELLRLQPGGFDSIDRIIVQSFLTTNAICFAYHALAS